MALNIKNSDAERLAAEVAKLTNTSLTQAVLQSLRVRRDQLVRQQARNKGIEQAREFLKRELWSKSGQRRDVTSDDDLLGYGDSGA